MTDAILSRAGGSIADFTGHRQTAFRELEHFTIKLKVFNREKQDKSCSLTQGITIGTHKVSADNVSLTGAVSLASMLTEIFLPQQWNAGAGVGKITRFTPVETPC